MRNNPANLAQMSRSLTSPRSGLYITDFLAATVNPHRLVENLIVAIARRVPATAARGRGGTAFGVQALPVSYLIHAPPLTVAVACDARCRAPETIVFCGMPIRDIMPTYSAPGTLSWHFGFWGI